MSTLHDIQSAFLHDIYSGDRTSAVYLDPSRGSVERLMIYRNNALFGLTDILANAYPVLKSLVGDAFFDMLARRYLRQHPQPRGDRHMFGADVPAFLEAFEPASALPYLSDVARLEWAHFQAGIAADATAIDFTALSASACEGGAAALALHPSVHLVHQRFNALDIWLDHQKDAPGGVQLSEAPHVLMIWRSQDNRVLIRTISAAFNSFLEHCHRGVDLAEALRAAENADPEGMDALQQDFAEAMAFGVFMNRKGLL